ncbi:hypothetical protein BDDG_04860 [Blastomyces dermatitidis ATCC 18188]|uniref:Uncharacterized protein n=1 Tax=Ajellomyces dermatitidis (strain ATCC 18188 / CBS 674.68) TaxID=653446 RepID=F2TFA4_AJEDA|nr:hypothetical protein BDDG_04860 [Blastomyces dermatitidis ATCC 18188]
MSYLRLLYQLATQPRPSGDHRPRIDGSTARKPKTWGQPQRNLLGISDGAGGVKLIGLNPGEGTAARQTQRNRAITGGGAANTTNAANVVQVNRSGSAREGHIVIPGCECVWCRRAMEAGDTGGGGKWW